MLGMNYVKGGEQLPFRHLRSEREGYPTGTKG